MIRNMKTWPLVLTRVRIGFPLPNLYCKCLSSSSKTWSSIQLKFFSTFFFLNFKKKHLGFFWKDFLWFSKISMVFNFYVFGNSYVFPFFYKIVNNFLFVCCFFQDFCLWKEVGVFFCFLTFFPWWFKVSSSCKCL